MLQIETRAQIPPRNFARKFEAAKRIGFPKINTGAEPIVVVIARFEWLPGQQTFANGAVTAVIAKNEGST